jgi:hypothetical protein
MKKLLVGLLVLGSISSYALPTDYTCSLVNKDSGKVIVESTGKIGLSERKGNENYILAVSNMMGYQLEVTLFDRQKDDYVVYSTVKLNGPGYIDGKADKGLRSLENPLSLEFIVPETELYIRCDRADDL